MKAYSIAVAVVVWKVSLFCRESWNKLLSMVNRCSWSWPHVPM